MNVKAAPLFNPAFPVAFADSVAVASVVVFAHTSALQMLRQRQELAYAFCEPMGLQKTAHVLKRFFVLKSEISSQEKQAAKKKNPTGGFFSL